MTYITRKEAEDTVLAMAEHMDIQAAYQDGKISISLEGLETHWRFSHVRIDLWDHYGRHRNIGYTREWDLIKVSHEQNILLDLRGMSFDNEEEADMVLTLVSQSTLLFKQIKRYLADKDICSLIRQDRRAPEKPAKRDYDTQNLKRMEKWTIAEMTRYMEQGGMVSVPKRNKAKTFEMLKNFVLREGDPEKVRAYKEWEQNRETICERYNCSRRYLDKKVLISDSTSDNTKRRLRRCDRLGDYFLCSQAMLDDIQDDTLQVSERG